MFSYLIPIYGYGDSILLLFPIRRPGKSIGISSILLGLVLIGRAAFVFPLSFLSNLTKKAPNEKITWRQQVSIWCMIRQFSFEFDLPSAN